MTIDSIDYEEIYQDCMTPDQLNLLDFLGVEWRGRNVNKIQDDIRSKITELAKLAIEQTVQSNPDQLSNIKSLLDYCIEQFSAPIEESDAPNAQIYYFDPITGTTQLVIAVEKKFWKKKWFKIAAAVVVVATVVTVVAMTAGTTTPAAAAGIAGAGAAAAPGSTRRKDDKDKKSPPSGSSPPPTKLSPYKCLPDLTPFPPPTENKPSLPSGINLPVTINIQPPSWRPQMPPAAVEPKKGPTLPTTLPHTKKIIEIPGKPLARGAIGGINGIGNSLNDAKTNAEYLSKLSGGHQVDWVYNKTNSIPIDLIESAVLNFSGISSPANDLMKEWTAFHEKHHNDPEAKLLQFCHSQGATHVKNTLASAPPEIRDRLIVLAVAPASVVPTALCHQSFNFASKRDIVPFAEAILKYDADAPYEERIAEPSRQALKELVLLDPHPDAKRFDHSLDSPTFKKVVTDILEDYTKKYGKPT
jgi:hypothetical protein